MSSNEDTYIHPQRFPKNTPGSFYSLGSVGSDKTWSGQCRACKLPEAKAPALLATLDDNNSDTYFIRQPETELEIEQACLAAEVCCVSAIRYGGKDPKIIRRLGSAYCDFAIVPGVGPQLPPNRRREKRWWQFWKAGS
jgi:hypothetical protein